MVQVESLCVEYKQGSKRIKALTNIEFDIPRGQTCSVIGPSGCGKTTLLYVLAGLISPTRGRVFIDNEVVRPGRLKTAIILQDYGLMPWKTVWENAALGLHIRKMSPWEIKVRVERILKELNIWKLKDFYPGQISGGQRQRTAIARALTLDPDLLLMDEPFSSLDALTREAMQKLLLNICRKNSITMVLVTHSIEEAVYLGQRIVVMSPGPGKIIKIFENPYFGDENLRNRPQFYEMCSRVRQVLEEGINGEKELQCFK